MSTFTISQLPLKVKFLLCDEPAVRHCLHAPKAKRVIYLFQSGGPSQFELFDYKPELNKMWGEEIPDSVRNGQRVSGMLASQSSFPLVGSKFKFKQHPKTGGYFSELMPYTYEIAEDICMINSMMISLERERKVDRLFDFLGKRNNLSK